MPFVVSAALAAESFPIAALSAAMGKIFISANSAPRMTPAKAGGMGGAL